MEPGSPSFRHFPKLKNAHFNGKTLPISRERNFTPNILGCCGLINKTRKNVQKKAQQTIQDGAGLFWFHDIHRQSIRVELPIEPFCNQQA